AVFDPGERIEPRADVRQRYAAGHARRAERGRPRRLVGVEVAELRRVVEQRAAVVVDERFGERAFRADEAVLGQFDVDILDGPGGGIAHDADAVRQDVRGQEFERAGRVRQGDRVLGRYEEIARRDRAVYPASQGAGANADRLEVAMIF